MVANIFVVVILTVYRGTLLHLPEQSVEKASGLSSWKVAFLSSVCGNVRMSRISSCFGKTRWTSYGIMNWKWMFQTLPAAVWWPCIAAFTYGTTQIDTFRCSLCHSPIGILWSTLPQIQAFLHMSQTVCMHACTLVRARMHARARTQTHVHARTRANLAQVIQMIVTLVCCIHTYMPTT